MDAHKEESVYKWLALAVVVVGTFMAILDSSIVNIAIPKMMAVFGVSTDEIQWVVTAYMLVMGAVIPLTGYLAERYGSKKTYMFAMVAFTIGSALCGFAWSNSSMIAARVLQALGGGMIMPISMAIIYQVVPPEERGMALGFWGIAAMAAPAIGPTLSGYIVQYLDWRLIFTINIPIGMVGVVLAGLILKPSPRREPKPFDFLGFFSVAIGLVCLLYVLGEGSNIDWNSLETVTLLLTGCFMLLIFVLNELSVENPLLDLSILKIWPFTLSILISGLTGIAMFGGVFIIPLFLQNLQGYTAMQAGMLMLPGAVASGLTMPISGKLFDRFGAKPVVIPGLAILTWTTYKLAFISLGTSSTTMMTLIGLRGLGMGLCMMPATTAGMNAVPPRLVAGASALSNTVRQVFNSMGLAMLTTFMQQHITINYSKIASQVSWFNPGSLTLMKTLQGVFTASGLGSTTTQGAAIMSISGMVQKEAMLQGINDTLLLATILAALTLPLAFMIKGKYKPHKVEKPLEGVN